MFVENVQNYPKLFVSWKHFVHDFVLSQENVGKISKFYDEFNGDQGTICEIYQIDENKTRVVIGVGVAKCSYPDKFDKNKGRKISLQRAINTTTIIPSPNDRKKFWEAYYKMRNSKW